MKEKTVIIDNCNLFEDYEKIEFGKDFKLPLNSQMIDYLFENELDEVINRIIETHNGKVTRDYIKGKKDRNCLARVSVFIPLEL